MLYIWDQCRQNIFKFESKRSDHSLLRNANNCIRKTSDNKYKTTNYGMNNNWFRTILKSLSSIISEIHAYNNYLLFKYLMIVLILIIIIILDLVLFQSIFGKMSFLFKMISFYGFCSAFSLLTIFINTASSVSFEPNISYKLLNKLLITNKKQISIRMKIKV
jgi:hypothetical protein